MTDISYPTAQGYPADDDISGVLSRYRRHLPLLIGITALCVAISGGVTRLMKPRYTAVAYVQFQPSQTLLNAQADPGAAGTAQSPEQVIETQSEILRSPSMAKAVIANLKLDEDPHFKQSMVALGGLQPVRDQSPEAVFRAVSGNLDASRVKLTSVFQISYTDTDPVQAATIANAFAQTYIQQQLDRKRGLVEGGSSLVSSQVAELRRAADAADAAVQNYRITHNLVSGTGGDTIAEQEVSSINQQLTSARAEEAGAIAKANAAHRQAASSSAGQDVGAALDSATISSLRQQRAAASQNLAGLTSRYGPLHPDVVKARQALGDIDGQIQQEINRILTNLDAEVQIASERRQSIEQSLDTSRQTLSTGAAATVQLSDLQRTADAAKEQYEAVLDRSNMTDSQAGLVQPDAQIMSAATPPSDPSSPNLILNLALGLAAGLSISIAVGYLRTQWASGLDTLDDVERQLGQRFFGSMPTVKSSIRKPGDKDPIDQVIAHPLSGYAEAYRNLAVSASYSPDGKPIKIIGLTSALPQEGKTTASICLARVLAMANAKVVMVDCDLRRRSMTQALKVRGEIGLVEVLEGRATLAQALVLDERSGAYLLPLTPGSENALSPFASEGIDKVLDQLREQFDMVIIDTAPVLAVVDTRILASRVDSLIMLVRWRKTPAKAARAALQLIESVGVTVSGVALSVVNLKAQAQSRYGDRSSYYYKAKSYYTS